MRRNAVRDAVVAELDAAGVPYRCSAHKGHETVIAIVHDGERRIWVPGTPSDQRAVLNARAFVRRMLRSRHA